MKLTSLLILVLFAALAGCERSSEMSRDVAAPDMGAGGYNVANP